MKSDDKLDYYNLKTCNQILQIFLEYAQDYGLLKSYYQIPEALMLEAKNVCSKINDIFQKAYKNDYDFDTLLINFILPNCFYAGMLSIAIWNKHHDDIFKPNLYDNLIKERGLIGLIEYSKELNYIYLGYENSIFERALNLLYPTVVDNCQVGKKQSSDFFKQQLEEFLVALFLMGANISCERITNYSFNEDNSSIIDSKNIYCEFENRKLIASNFWKRNCQRCYSFFYKGIIYFLVPDNYINYIEEMKTSDYCSLEYDENSYVIVFDDGSEAPFCVASEIGAMNKYPDCTDGGINVYSNDCKLEFCRVCKFIDGRKKDFSK